MKKLHVIPDSIDHSGLQIVIPGSPVPESKKNAPAKTAPAPANSPFSTLHSPRIAPARNPKKRPALATLTAAILVLLLTCIPFAGAVSAAGEASVTVLVPQTFTIIAGSPPSSTFAYTLTPVNNPNAPLPTAPGSVTNGVYTYTLTGNETAELTIAFTAPGAYHYRLTCATPASTGYTLDTRAYRIEITVAANMSPVTVAYDEAKIIDKTNPAFAHSYNYIGGGGGGGGPAGLTIPEEEIPLANIEDEETPGADMPLLENLPQTGQLRWPVPVLTFSGAMLLIIGWMLNRRRTQEEQ
jgi:hypothetical protein